MASSLPSPMQTPSRTRTHSRTIKWSPPRPLVSSDSDSEIDTDLPNYSVTLNKRTEHIPNHLFATTPRRADTSVQLEFNTECDVDVTLSAGNIDVLLKSPDKSSTMHLTRRMTDGAWNVQMRKSPTSTAAIQVLQKESGLASIRRRLFNAAPPSREWFQLPLMFVREVVAALIFVGIIARLLQTQNQAPEYSYRSYV